MNKFAADVQPRLSWAFAFFFPSLACANEYIVTREQRYAQTSTQSGSVSVLGRLRDAVISLLSEFKLPKAKMNNVSDARNNS